MEKPIIASIPGRTALRSPAQRRHAVGDGEWAANRRLGRLIGGGGRKAGIVGAWRAGPAGIPLRSIPAYRRLHPSLRAASPRRTGREIQKATPTASWGTISSTPSTPNLFRRQSTSMPMK